MSLRRPPKIFFQLVFAALATIAVGNACGQDYPTTQHGSFAGGVSGSPSGARSPHAVAPVDRSQSSVSPISWNSTVPTAKGLSEFQYPAPSPTPSVPNLSDDNSFQPGSAFVSQPNPTPNSLRYPLGNSPQATPRKTRTGLGARNQDTLKLESPANSPVSSIMESQPGKSQVIWFNDDPQFRPEAPQSSSRFNNLPPSYSRSPPGNTHSDFTNGGIQPTPSAMTPDYPIQLAPVQQPPQFNHGFGFAASTQSQAMGRRSDFPTSRGKVLADNGESFDFENKKTLYPPIKEILATGRYFGSASTMFLKGAFQNNTAITASGLGLSTSTPFDFDYEAAPNFRLGFESKYGPGVELNYWQYDETSNVASFTSDGVTTGETSVLRGLNQLSRLQALNAGELLESSQTIDVESVGASFFKEVQFKISRLNGIFGVQYVSVAQSLDATLSSGGTEIGRLISKSDLRGFGPKFGLEYYRPVGHTKLELITTVGGSVVFGQRDQFIQNTVTQDVVRSGADEFLTTINFMSGVQYKKMTAENRAIYARLGFTYETWLGGGTGTAPQGDFGLRGFTFGLGYNR